MWIGERDGAVMRRAWLDMRHAFGRRCKAWQARAYALTPAPGHLTPPWHSRVSEPDALTQHHQTSYCHAPSLSPPCSAPFCAPRYVCMCPLTRAMMPNSSAGHRSPCTRSCTRSCPRISVCSLRTAVHHPGGPQQDPEGGDVYASRSVHEGKPGGSPVRFLEGRGASARHPWRTTGEDADV